MNSCNPKISIIVPVYKVEDYLEKCVNSILNQTFKDFELILVDDGSPDRCPQICDELCKLDSRISVIHKINGGVSSARNIGIKAAKGKYIMFCDSDDIVDSRWCEYFFEAAEDNPNNYIVSSIWRCSKHKKIKQSINSDCRVENLNYFDIFKIGLSGYPVNKIFRKDIILRNNILFNEKLNLGEDAIFNVEYFKYCQAITYIDMPTYYYIDNLNSSMHVYRRNLLQIHLTLFNKRVSVIDDKDLGEFCDIYLSMFINMFEEVYKDKDKGILSKLNFNQQMMNSKEFRFCLENASGKNESSIFLKILRTHNYYLLYCFQKLMKLKNKVKGC